MARPRKPTPADRIPRIVDDPTVDDHLRVMTRAVFQAGLSWAFIESRWPAFETAFGGFHASAIAAYDASEVERLMGADGLVHSRSKIEGTVRNARALLALERELGDLRRYSAGFSSWNALLRDVKKRFAYVGNLSAYYWCFRTGQRVPPRESWQTTEAKDHPRIAEMVNLARGEGRTPEDVAFAIGE